MTDMRRCIGSTKFGIEAHEAPPNDFPAQPSQRDGLGRMCRLHWNQYTTALRKAAATAKSEGGATTPEPIKTTGSPAKGKAQEPIAKDPEAGTA